LLEDRKPANTRPADLESGRNNVEKPQPVTPNTTDDSIPPKPSPVPFHRTRRGIIIIVVVAVVALAAIIGGAVGGSLSKKSVSLPSSPAGGSATSSAVQNGDPLGFTSIRSPTPVLPTAITPDQGSGSTNGGGMGTNKVHAEATPAPALLSDWQELGLVT